ncbi:MAG TPA: ribonuclease P protein component [Gemmatimonadales bacterium]|nr:ribonuclease P protein component [Microlunatus sp.]HPF62925.1 ribonuclease P protein component [Gemmatimonadales bacterium]HRX19586.1 ribonuclease P protein component [Gemmatimonadales bacterium]
MTGDERLGRSRRIGRGTDIQRVLRRGRRSKRTHLDIRWATSEQGEARLGLIVPRHGRTAVARNRLQRRLRELWRRDVRGHLPPIDVVVRAGPSAYEAPFQVLRTDLLGWLESLP